MFGLNSGNCLSVLGTVGVADMMNSFIVLKYFMTLNIPNSMAEAATTEH